jgi:hypothetical protein
MPQGLGNIYNVVPTADAVEVACKDVGYWAFVCVGADTYTIHECTDAGGAGAQTLAVITHHYPSTSASGAAVWTKTTLAANSAVTIAAGITVIEVDTKSMSDGFDYLRCTSTAAGLVVAIATNLHVRRDPRNLPALAV